MLLDFTKGRLEIHSAQAPRTLVLVTRQVGQDYSGEVAILGEATHAHLRRGDPSSLQPLVSDYMQTEGATTIHEYRLEGLRNGRTDIRVMSAAPAGDRKWYAVIAQIQVAQGWGVYISHSVRDTDRFFGIYTTLTDYDPKCQAPTPGEGAPDTTGATAWDRLRADD